MSYDLISHLFTDDPEICICSPLCRSIFLTLSLTASKSHTDDAALPGMEHVKITLILMILDSSSPSFANYLDILPSLFYYLSQSLDQLFLLSDFLSHVALCFH